MCVCGGGGGVCAETIFIQKLLVHFTNNYKEHIKLNLKFWSRNTEIVTYTLIICVIFTTLKIISSVTGIFWQDIITLKLWNHCIVSLCSFSLLFNDVKPCKLYKLAGLVHKVFSNIQTHLLKWHPHLFITSEIWSLSLWWGMTILFRVNSG